MKQASPRPANGGRTITATVGLSLAGIVGLAISASAVLGGSQQTPRGNAKSAPADAGSPARAAMERLKSLAGEWVPVDAKGEDAGKPVLTYRVVSAGHAVLEFVMPGSPHEMVTVYHLDGDTIMLTHYCAVGNQPRMKSAGLKRDRLEFEFCGGTNMRSANDAHMHTAAFEFVDADRFRSTWQMHQDGKADADHRVTFDVVRKK